MEVLSFGMVTFDPVNYKRWLPLCFEDCLPLKDKFLAINESFTAGGFVVRHTKGKANAFPMDQALEKAYNKPEKNNSGVFGISRRNNTVCLWNIINHEKAKFKNFLQKWCCLNEYDDYMLHHHFSTSTTVANEKCVNAINEYVTKHENPFDPENSNELTNMITNSQIDHESSTFLQQCLKLGEDAHQNFYQTRLVDKTEKLFGTHCTKN